MSAANGGGCTAYNKLQVAVLSCPEYVEYTESNELVLEASIDPKMVSDSRRFGASEFQR